MRRVLAAPLAALVLLVSACGVPGGSDPVPLDSAALPEEPVPAEAAGEEVEREGTVVYVVAEDRLHAVSRPVPATVPAAVRALLEGPRETEAALGLRTAIPAGTRLLSASVDASTIRLDLSSEFVSVVGDEHLMALAQLVYTVTETSPTHGVAISIQGQPVAVAGEDGQLLTRPVRRDDYPSAVAA